MIVDSDLRLLMANRAALVMLDHGGGGAGDGAPPFLVRRAGDVLECVHALGPGGCGRGEPCKGCVIRDSIHQAFTTGAVHRAKAVMQLHREGADVDVCMLVSAACVDHEGERRVILTLEDVSDVIRLKDEVRRREDRYSQLFHSMTEGFASHEIVCDEQGRPTDYRFLEVNPAFEQLTGLERERVLGRLVRDVLPGIEPHWIEIYGRVALTGEPAHFDSLVAELGRHYEVFAFSPQPRQFATLFVDITERKQAMDAIRESEERYRSLFELSGDAIVAVDLEGRFTDANPAALSMLGYTRDELLNLDYQRITPERWHAMTDAALRGQVQTSGSSDEYEKEYVRKDGTAIPVSVRAFLKKDLAGRPVGSWAIVRDCTERKRAEETLRESEARYRALFENSPLPKWLYDVKTLRFLAVNDAAVCHYGYTREEFLGMTIKDIRPPEDVEDLLKSLPATALDQAQHGTWRHRKKDGTLIEVEIGGQAFMLRDRAARLVVVRDVTETRREEEARARLTVELERELSERKRIEKELVERADMAALSADVGMAVTQEDTLRDMLQRCAEAIVHRLGAAFARIWVCGPEDGVLTLQASAGMYTHLDGPHGRVAVGKLKIGKIAEEQRPHLTNDVLEDPLVDREWAKREGMVSFVGHPLLIGGKLIGVMAMFARHPLGDVALKGLASIADAVAVAIRRGLAESARASLEEQFHQAQKLESVGRLAGGIAHDFNNLLTVILSGAEALKHDLGQRSPPDPGIVEEIGAAGARARDLTRQLLAFARKQVIAPVPLDLNTLMRSGEKLLRRVLGEDVEVVVALQPALWPVRCDRGQIEQVVLNLAVNARDAMPNGGTLTVETSNFQADETHSALFPGLQPGPYVRLAVQDTGTGMAPDVKGHVFEPFFTTKPVGKGTGLGLATVYGIVNQAGGFIRVESEPGHGTTFELLLPRISRAAATGVAAAPVATRRGTETILVVEDDPQVREVTVRSLRAGGYVVLAASCGREALDLGARERGSLQLLVTDVVMPGLDGHAVANELRRHHSEMRVLYVSGHAEDAIVKRGVLEPGIEFLPKPFTASSLLARVRAVLDAR